MCCLSSMTQSRNRTVRSSEVPRTVVVTVWLFYISTARASRCAVTLAMDRSLTTTSLWHRNYGSNPYRIAKNSQFYGPYSYGRNSIQYGGEP
ncbi:hypothetical protein B0H15DRAFT_541428 [Mycena belliarum]|uniref:Uncharacterized protein n=1 Tax=Mycena belliarum TaxID=1033014 RepID=A0AAD6UJP2_9AGAR|nr:hypothetical protein B0H15DRAFT_541428 [Mycena belliae]